MSSSTESVVSHCEYWIRVNLALEICIKEALIDVVHNKRNDHTYIGLPEDGTDLYNYMILIQESKKHPLHKLLRNGQWDTLCPQSKQTNTKDWDINLLVTVIRSELNIKPFGGWNVQTVYVYDKSIGAYAFMAKEIDSSINHGNFQELITPTQFTTYWNDIKSILKGLHYGRMNLFHRLETEHLYSHVAIIGKTLHSLELKIDGLNGDVHARDARKHIESLKKYLKHLTLGMTAIKNEKNHDNKTEKKDSIEWKLRQTVPNFHGREKLLQEIHSLLQTPAEDDHKPVILYGTTGMGKTQVAAMYIKQYRDLYFNIFWINSCEFHRSLLDIVKSISKSAVQVDITIRFLLETLSKHIENEKTLVVVDDLDNKNDLQKLLQNLDCVVQPDILVTTQIENLDCQKYHLIQVPCFDQIESISFLQKELSLDDTKNGIEDLASVLQSFPLAIQQAAHYLKKYKIPITDYLCQFNINTENQLNGDNFKSDAVEHDEILSTVLKLALKKLAENLNALNILGMMAYMDHKRINRNTFLLYGGIKDESELDEIVELLSEFRLIHVHENDLQMHSIVQKILRIYIDENLMIFQEDPIVLLSNLLHQIIALFETDPKHTDKHNLWYPHLCLIIKTLPLEFPLNFTFFNQVALNRNDKLNALYGTEILYNHVVSYYDETKHFNAFLKVVKLNSERLALKAELNQLTTEDLVTFSSRYEKELSNTDAVIISWKIQQASSFISLKDVKKSRNLVIEIFKQINDQDIGCNTYILLELAILLWNFDIQKCKEILQRFEVSRIEDDLYSRHRTLSLKCDLALKENKLDFAEDILNKWKKILNKAEIPLDHSYYVYVADCSILLLLKRGKYNKVLRTVDECVAVNESWWDELRCWKISALISLHKYEEALELFSEVPVATLNINESALLAYLKFLRHDFDGFYRLLDTKSEFDKNLCYWIRFYVMTLEKVNQQRKSVQTSKESLSRLVENCIAFKRKIMGLFHSTCDFIFVTK